MGIVNVIRRFLEREREIGRLRFRGRTVGLVVNLAANFVTLLGISFLLRSEAAWGWPMAIGGGVVTVLCIAVLAVPVGEGVGERD